MASWNSHPIFVSFIELVDGMQVPVFAVHCKWCSKRIIGFISIGPVDPRYTHSGFRETITLKRPDRRCGKTKALPVFGSPNIYIGAIYHVFQS